MTKLTDITDSESNLLRLSNMALRIKSSTNKENEFIVDKIKEEDLINLNNTKVIKRHLRILKGINFISYDTKNPIRLTGAGKAISEFSSFEDSTLNKYQKALWFRNMFKYLKEQLFPFLESVDIFEPNRKRIVVRYFEKMGKDGNFWEIETIENNLSKYRKEDILPVYFDNKSKCMEKWLQSLDLIKRNNKKIRFTERGRNLYKKIKSTDSDSDEWSKDFFYLFSFLLEGRFESFSPPLAKKEDNVDLATEKKYEIVEKFLKKSFPLFKTSFNMADYKAVKLWILAKLLIDEKIIIPEKLFKSVIHKLWEKGISVSLDLKGGTDEGNIILEK